MYLTNVRLGKWFIWIVLTFCLTIFVVTNAVAQSTALPQVDKITVEGYYVEVDTFYFDNPQPTACAALRLTQDVAFVEKTFYIPDQFLKEWPLRTDERGRYVFLDLHIADPDQATAIRESTIANPVRVTLSTPFFTNEPEPGPCVVAVNIEDVNSTKEIVTGLHNDQTTAPPPPIDASNDSATQGEMVPERLPVTGMSRSAISLHGTMAAIAVIGGLFIIAIATRQRTHK